jgi:uncharacterized protein
MTDTNTIRILSLDGGGERGYLSLKFLIKFIELWGINPGDIAQRFDVICGTSIGGIMGLAFAFGKTPGEIESFFTEKGRYIFTLGSETGGPVILYPTPGIVPSATYKLTLLGLDIPFYNSSGTYADKYGTGLLSATLGDFFGTATLADLQTKVLIPSYQTDTGTFVSFSNYQKTEFIGQNELIKNVALATSAAPLYLASNSHPVSFGGHQYSDGGVYLNNPALMGMALGKMLKPSANRVCILSLGTGLVPGEGSYQLFGSSFREYLQRNLTDTVNPLAILGALVNQAGGGSEESVAKTLQLISRYTLDQLYYYRYQPIFDDLPPEQLPTLDNTTETILNYYATKAESWYQNDFLNIQNFIGHLDA